MEQSHTVQSIRARVEQTIRQLKLFRVMQSNKLQAAAFFEKVLDCVMALHNLKILFKMDPNFAIPARRNALPGEHIFLPKIKTADVDLKIPANEPNLEAVSLRHIREFTQFLASAARGIRKALKRKGDEGVFFPNVLTRAENLYKGAYVLQLRVQNEAEDFWTVKYLVGASYSYQTHTGYVQMTKESAALNHICDCYSGWENWWCFEGEFVLIFFLAPVSSGRGLARIWGPC